MHEPPAATADLAVLPGVLASRPLRRTEQVRLSSEPLWLPGGTAISTASRRRLVHNAGWPRFGRARIAPIRLPTWTKGPILGQGRAIRASLWRLSDNHSFHSYRHLVLALFWRGQGGLRDGVHLSHLSLRPFWKAAVSAPCDRRVLRARDGCNGANHSPLPRSLPWPELPAVGQPLWGDVARAGSAFVFSICAFTRRDRGGRVPSAFDTPRSRAPSCLLGLRPGPPSRGAGVGRRFRG